MSTAAPGGGMAAPSPTGSQTERPPAEAKNLLAGQPEPSASGLSTDEEAQLGKLQAKVAAAAVGPAPVRLKVEAPHSSVTFGGITVGSEYTEVPGHAVGALMEGAADAGVTITQDQES